MFCQNCGNQNGDGSLFCESCGAKLIAPAAPAVEPVPVEAAPVEAAPVVEATPVTPVTPVAPVAPAAAAPAAPKEKKGLPFNPLMIVAAVEVVVLIVAIVVFATTLKKANNYEKTACAFWNKLAAGKYEEAYTYLYIDDDDEDALTKESFVAAMKTAPYAEAEKVKIKKSSASDSKGKFKVNFEYDDEDYSIDFALVKKDKKWKIDASSFTTKVTVNNVPAGADLYVDGVKVASKKENADKYDTMKVVVFEGTHEYYAKVDVFETTKTYSSYEDVYVGSLRLGEEENKALCEKALEITEEVAKAAIAGDGFDAIEDYFTDSQNSYSTNENEYDYWASSFFATNISSYSQDQSGLTKISLEDLTAEYSYLDTYSSATRVSIIVKGTKTYEYKYYDADDMAFTTEKTSDPENMSMYVEFVYEDGEWLAIDIDDFYNLKSYSRY